MNKIIISFIIVFFLLFIFYKKKQKESFNNFDSFSSMDLGEIRDGENAINNNFLNFSDTGNQENSKYNTYFQDNQCSGGNQYWKFTNCQKNNRSSYGVSLEECKRQCATNSNGKCDAYLYNPSNNICDLYKFDDDTIATYQCNQPMIKNENENNVVMNNTDNKYLMADNGNANESDYFLSPFGDTKLAVTYPGGFQNINRNNVMQRFRLKKCRPGRNPLGGASSWYPTNASEEERTIRGGDIVALYSPQNNKVYDCAWGPGQPCSQQPFPPPGGNWGSPMKIHIESGSDGEKVNLTFVTYFTRMWHFRWNSSLSIRCDRSQCRGVHISQRTKFRFQPLVKTIPQPAISYSGVVNRSVCAEGENFGEIKKTNKNYQLGRMPITCAKDLMNIKELDKFYKMNMDDQKLEIQNNKDTSGLSCKLFIEGINYKKNKEDLKKYTKEADKLQAEYESEKRAQGCSQVKSFVPQNSSGVCSPTNKCDYGSSKCLGLSQAPGDGGCNKACSDSSKGQFYRSDLGGCVQNYCECPTAESCKDGWFLKKCGKSCTYVLGTIGMGPWGKCPGFLDQNAKWIWNEKNANLNAPRDIYIPFYYEYKSDSDQDVIINVIADDYSRVYLNNAKIGSANGGWGGPGTKLNGTLVKGYNSITINAVNAGGPAGIVATVVNKNSNKILFSTNSDWVVRHSKSRKFKIPVPGIIDLCTQKNSSDGSCDYTGNNALLPSPFNVNLTNGFKIKTNSLAECKQKCKTLKCKSGLWVTGNPNNRKGECWLSKIKAGSSIPCGTGCVSFENQLVDNSLKWDTPYLFLNLWKGTPPGSFLGSCGYSKTGCGSNLSVTTFKVNNSYITKYPTWGSWKIKPKNNTSRKTVNYGDEISIHLTANNAWLLTCNLSNCRNGSQYLSVSASTNTSNKQIFGGNAQYWKIVSTTGKSGPVQLDDTFKIENAWGAKSYLNTCNYSTSCGSGKVYNVNTCRIGSRDSKLGVSDWKIVKAPLLYTCTAGWSKSCGESCARSKCISKRGKFPNLDFWRNPYTCKFNYGTFQCPPGYNP